MTVKLRWWWLPIVAVMLAGFLANDWPGWISAAIVGGGILVWIGWPVLHARHCMRRLARALEREDAALARRWLERLPSFETAYGKAWVRIHEAGILNIEERYGEARQLLDADFRAGPSMDLVRENALAWCEAHDGADDAAVKRAEATLERAQKEYRGLVSYCLGTLGVARVLAGQSTPALEPLQHALMAGRPPRAQAIRAYYLGEAYRTSGRVDDALAAYERARKEAPSSRWAQKAHERITELASSSPYR